MFGDMKQLSLKTINASSPYDVMMVNPNTYRFVTDYSVEIAISFDLDDLLEHGEAYMFNITNVNNYAAMILRKDNPHFVDYVSEFNNTVNMFMLKPEHQPAGLINKGDYVMNIEEKKADFMRRFKASRERKAEYIAQMEKRMRDDYRRRTGKEAESFCVL